SSDLNRSTRFNSSMEETPSRNVQRSATAASSSDPPAGIDRAERRTGNHEFDAPTSNASAWNLQPPASNRRRWGWRPRHFGRKPSAPLPKATATDPFLPQVSHSTVWSVERVAYRDSLSTTFGSPVHGPSLWASCTQGKSSR